MPVPRLQLRGGGVSTVCANSGCPEEAIRKGEEFCIIAHRDPEERQLGHTWIIPGQDGTTQAIWAIPSRILNQSRSEWSLG